MGTLKLRNGLPTKKSINEMLHRHGIKSYHYSGIKEKDRLSIYWQTNGTQKIIMTFLNELEMTMLFKIAYRPYESPTTGCIQIFPEDRQDEVTEKN